MKRKQIKKEKRVLSLEEKLQKIVGLREIAKDLTLQAEALEKETSEQIRELSKGLIPLDRIIIEKVYIPSCIGGCTCYECHQRRSYRRRYDDMRYAEVPTTLFPTITC